MTFPSIPKPPVLSIVLPVQQEPEAPRFTKVPRTGLRSFVARKHKEQGGICPLCKMYINLTIKGEGVCDHDHDTGRIRGILHRSCNAAEGKISNAAARWGAKSAKYEDIIPYLKAVVAYLETPASTFIYPMHKTADEKVDARKAKARAVRAANRAKLAMRGTR